MHRLPFSDDPPFLDSFAKSLPPFPAVSSLRSGSHRSTGIIITEPKLRDRSIPSRKLHARFSAAPVSISKSRPLSRAHEEESPSRDNIDRERKTERERERKRRTGLEGFSLPFSLSTCAPTSHEPAPRTYLASVRPIARELRKAMQARATRWALVPSYVLTSDSWLVLSARPSHPGLSLSVYLVVSLSLLPSPPDDVHARSPSLVLFPVTSFSLLIFDADVLRPRRSFSLLLGRRRTTILVRWSVISRSHSPLAPTDYKSFDLFTSPLSQILHLSQFVLVFRSMPLRLLQYNLIRSSPAAVYGQRRYRTRFSPGKCVR